MKCLLLALTGMGNEVLRACLSHEAVDGLLVVTRAETGPFPYYPCPDLAGECARLGVECLAGADLRAPGTLDALRAFAPDIALAATFHQIVPPEVLRLPRLGVFNAHPSLLPCYKGPMPTNWAIIHGEKHAGVTIHRMTEGLDEGDIVLQRRVDIGGDTDGELRRRLAVVAGELAGELLVMAAAGTISASQQSGPGSRHPRLLSPEGLNLLETGGFKPENIRRGATPWPGPDVLAARLARAAAGQGAGPTTAPGAGPDQGCAASPGKTPG